MSTARSVGLNKEVGKQVVQRIPNHKIVQRGWLHSG